MPELRKPKAKDNAEAQKTPRIAEKRDSSLRSE